MKKFLSMMLIAVIAVSTVFAATGYIGASSGYSFNFSKVADEVKQTSASIPVSVDGATMFGKGNFNFGFSYGAEICNIPMGVKVGSSLIKPEEIKVDWAVSPYAGIAFQYRFSKGFGLAGSVNATYSWDTVKTTVLGKEAKGTTHQLGMMGNLYANINLGAFNLRLGGIMEGPIGYWNTGSAFGIDASGEMHKNMGPFNVVPFAGIGFAY